MIKRLFLTVVFLIPFFVAFAQDDKQSSWEQRKRQFKAEKIAYITTEMNFTVQDAQKFWPIYNKYDEILDKIGERRRKNFAPKAGGIDALTEEQCALILDNNVVLDNEELLAKQNFYKELKEVFSHKMIMKYYHAEHEFRRKLISDKQNGGASFGKSYKEN
ncbi:MAG: hypothetical protein II956_08950 [Bacteroidales bacterium]|nr:hypothetical protein [Bacteroidales bacterium]